MHKTEGYRGWYIPEDATTEVDDKTIYVPEFTISVRKAIIAYADSSLPKPNIYDSDNMLRQWITSRTGLELQALRHYFLDRWTWDTGCDYDKYANIIAEREISRRRNVTNIVEGMKKEMADLVSTMRVPSSML